MTAPSERTKSMRAYAAAYGDPNHEISGRLERGLETMIARDEARETRRFPWLLLSVLVLVVGGVGLGVGLWLASDTSGVVTATEGPRRIRLSSGTAVLRAGAEIRVLHDDVRGILELRAGAIEVEGARGGGTQVVSGGYTVDAGAATFVVKHAPGVPVVTVSRGEVVVRGPDLPESGVTIIPVAPPE